MQRTSKIRQVMLVSFLCCGMIWIPEAFLCVSVSGCEAEVPLGSGWGHGEAGRAGEEDRQGCGGVQALLGGTQAGQTGQSAVLGGKGKQFLSLFGHVPFRCYTEPNIHFVIKNQEMTGDLSCTRSRLYSLILFSCQRSWLCVSTCPVPVWIRMDQSFLTISSDLRSLSLRRSIKYLMKSAACIKKICH